MHMKPILLGLSSLLMPLIAGAQSIGPATLNAAGGSAALNGNTYEWSAGEMAVVSTYAGASLVVTQGVLQPNITAPNAVGQNIRPLLDVAVYPNPVTADVLYMQPRFTHSGVLHYRLTDAASRTVQTQSCSLTTGSEQQAIDMKGLLAGQYLLSVQWQDGGTLLHGNYQVLKLR